MAIQAIEIAKLELQKAIKVLFVVISLFFAINVHEMNIKESLSFFFMLRTIQWLTTAIHNCPSSKFSKCSFCDKVSWNRSYCDGS